MCVNMFEFVLMCLCVSVGFVCICVAVDDCVNCTFASCMSQGFGRDIYCI